MIEGEEKRARGILRYNLASPRTYAFDVIPFDQQPVRTEHVVRVLDFSVVGVGIESSVLIDPGLVYFREPMGGQKFGVLIWSIPKDDGYRAGIRFVTLLSDEEEYLRKQIRRTHLLNVLPDPENIIATLLDAVKNETKE